MTSAGLTSGAQAIAAAFAAEGRAALMPYMMGGFPDMETSRRVAEAYADGGADLVELGFPFSDPLADGPVVHAAGTAALRAGATTHEVLALGRALAERVPVVAMVYANLVIARGLERFADDLATHAISGLIVPDLPLEESDGVRKACDAAGIALVPLVAPTTPDERMARIGASARGFVYAVSVTGTTGERAALPEVFADIVARAKAATEVPVAVGFGIGTPELAREAANAGADGVIVGSRLVRAVAEAEDPPAAVHALVARFAQALK
jgi:tryptophan synthase alpha chain